MKKRSWLLLIVILTGVVAWYYLFYKTYSRSSIAQSADIVLSVDVKRNTNSIIYYYLTTPSEWNIGSLFRKASKDSFDWKAAIDIPDYIFLFHSKGQPADAFYTVLDIKDEDEFNKGLKVYGFAEVTKNEYYSEKLAIGIIKNGEQILVGHLTGLNQHLLQGIADELFNKKKYFDERSLEKITAAANHFSLYVQKNEILQEDAIINGNFKNGELVIDASLKPIAGLSFIENDFQLHDQSLLSLAFAQPDTALYSIMSIERRAAISKAVNFDIDSVFFQKNKQYTLDIQSFKNRTDSAITFTYDDDFNKVEKVIENIVQEPSFNLLVVKNDSSNNILKYWRQNKSIEETEKGDLFVNIPFVKTYVFDKNDSLLLRSDNYSTSIADKQFRGLVYLNADINKAPDNIFNYLPDNLKVPVKRLKQLNVGINNVQGNIAFRLSLKCNSDKKPFLLSFR